MTGFLGLKIDRSNKGTATLTQTGLMDQILTVMEIKDSNPQYTPTDKEPSNKDLDGELCREN